VGHAEFDLRALYEALDEQRRARDMTWAAVAREVSRIPPGQRAEGHPIAPSTITSLETKRVGEGDGILAMLLWLGRSPESFIPGFEGAEAERYRLPEGLSREQCLRWDTRALHAALNARRQDRRMTWKQVAGEIGGCTPGMLMNLSKGGRVGFPGVMRLVRWLGQPAADFTRVAGAWGQERSDARGPDDRKPTESQAARRAFRRLAIQDGVDVK
jgi:hypothetical protein